MVKPLNEMSLEELWELFPIILTAHQEAWEDWYHKEEAQLRKVLENKSFVRISHIGSTAIKDIWAKPIIDILIELKKETDIKEIITLLAASGYLLMSEEMNNASFNKGYTLEGFAPKVFHLHLRYQGDNNELYFRDYLNEYPDIAKQYETLKLSLWKKYEHNRDGYTNAKGNFIDKYTKMAKDIYNNKYS